MKKNRQRISCVEVRGWDMVTFLSRLGYEPTKIRGSNYWYISPLRHENTASFKVDRIRNRWWDFGDGRGGNLVDFGLLYYNCSVADFLQQVNNNFSFPTPVSIATPNIREKAPDKILIKTVRPIAHPALVQYLASRHISLPLAASYCQEVIYENLGKLFCAIGFKNNSGGYELRSRHFKGGSSPKDYTLIPAGYSSLIIFEGFFDFLSCLTLFPDTCNATDFLILNSLSFFNRAVNVIGTYANVDFCLDNNRAGTVFTQKALALYPHSIDRRYLYTGYEDLNDCLCNKPIQDATGNTIQQSDDPP